VQASLRQKLLMNRLTNGHFFFTKLQVIKLGILYCAHDQKIF
jgi:hypothetical protein